MSENMKCKEIAPGVVVLESAQVEGKQIAEVLNSLSLESKILLGLHDQSRDEKRRARLRILEASSRCEATSVG